LGNPHTDPVFAAKGAKLLRAIIETLGIVQGQAALSQARLMDVDICGLYVLVETFMYYIEYGMLNMAKIIHTTPKNS
jgi:hypothetical protein